MRDRTPKMLYFPDLGSQVGISERDLEASVCPWNNTLYLESENRSILFLTESLRLEGRFLKGLKECKVLHLDTREFVEQNCPGKALGLYFHRLACHCFRGGI